MNQTDDSFSLESPIECYKLNIISFYCAILLLISIVINTSLLWVFYRYDDLRTSFNRFIIVLTFFNLIGSLTELPFVIVSNFYCK